jgi:TubC N-terminal docking domain
MTEAERIVEGCAARGVLLSLGDSSSELAFDAPAGALTIELRERIAAHKADIIEFIFEREERAALSGCPDWMDARKWLRAAEHPATLKLLDLFGGEVVEVRPMERRERAA